ncbi:MAG: AMIN domain-containing protein [Acidobacteria bacterium]|nr:AMIN domain-containing protein [Acidobacteriota bacterium]
MRARNHNSGARLLAVALCALPLLHTPPLGATPALITQVRVVSEPRATRVTVDVEGEMAFTPGRAKEPPRLYFDFAGTRHGLGDLKRTHTIPVGDALVRQIRVAANQEQVTRIVLDLVSADVRFSTSRTDSGRLVIEVRAKGTPVVLPTARPVRIPLITPPRLYAANPSPAVPTVLIALQKQVLRVPFPPQPERTEARVAVPEPAITERTVPERTLPPPAAPAAATAARRAEQSLIRALGLKLRRVAIDAGHGGNDVGSTGPGGLREKDLTLDVARRLAALVEARLGAEVILTREDDRYVALEQRPALARERGADLFLSIHANSSGLRSATGVETYYLSHTTSKQAIEVAARENATAAMSIHELKDLNQKIVMNDKIVESRDFAMRIQSAMASRARDRGVRKAPFIVLMGAEVPAVLAEIGFLSNPREEAQLSKPEHRQRIAEMLYKGLAAYAASLSRTQVAQRGGME